MVRKNNGSKPLETLGFRYGPSLSAPDKLDPCITRFTCRFVEEAVLCSPGLQVLFAILLMRTVLNTGHNK